MARKWMICPQCRDAGQGSKVMMEYIADTYTCTWCGAVISVSPAPDVIAPVAPAKPLKGKTLSEAIDGLPFGLTMTIITILIVLGAAFGLSWAFDNGEDAEEDEDDTYTPPPPTFHLYLSNSASEEIHVWVYFDGLLKWELYLGTGWLDGTNSKNFDLTSGVKVTTQFSLSYSTWTIGGTWYDGDSCYIDYHNDGTVSYSG